jgi:hypothetical protein
MHILQMDRSDPSAMASVVQAEVLLAGLRASVRIHAQTFYATRHICDQAGRQGDEAD